MLKLIILDIDGVLTDGKKYYDRDGNVVLKNFCDKDWTAIKRFRSLGVDIFFITGDPFNAKILDNRNLPYIVNRGKGFHNDKVNFLNTILEKFKVTTDETLYLGDDVFDVNIMQSVKYKFCPADAPAIVKNISNVLTGNGGENLIKELFDFLQENQIIKTENFEDEITKIYDLDIRESF